MQVFARIALLIFLLSLIAEAMAAPILQSQEVTNIDDSGVGSLRAAINGANSNLPNPTEITFELPGDPPFVIQPQSPLPNIFATVFIRGDSQAKVSAYDGLKNLRVTEAVAVSGRTGKMVPVGQ